METRKFKVAHLYTPEVFEESLLNEETDYFGLFKLAIKCMRFSYDYRMENSPSRLLPNGSWTGLIGLLNRSEVDFVPGSFLLTEDRWEAVAFNYPHNYDDITFVSRKPQYHPESMAIFRTLSVPVWTSLLASIIVFSLVFFVVLRYRYTFYDVMLHALAIALNQGGNKIPQKAGVIVLLCTWMLAMTLFTSCFKSVLLSFLSFPRLSGVRDVPELAAAIRAGKYTAMAGEVHETVPFYLQKSQNEGIRLIGENIPQNPPGHIEDFLNKTVNSNVVSVYRRSYVNYLEEKLYISEDSVGCFLMATAVSKNFCCKDELNMIVHRFFASGINEKISRLKDFKSAFTDFSKLPDDEVARKITLTDIFGAFIILVAGYCLSAFTLMIELAVKRIEVHHSSTV